MSKVVGLPNIRWNALAALEEARDEVTLKNKTLVCFWVDESDNDNVRYSTCGTMQDVIGLIELGKHLILTNN